MPHLHSTLLLLYLLPSVLTLPQPSTFTFHFASTLSHGNRKGKQKEFNLHSTLLLLYLVTILGTLVVVLFTFHFASTLSLTGMADSVYKNHLHSTLLLLYQYWLLDKNEENYQFTFHFASTLSRSLIRKNLRCPIYIPLCFYFIWCADMTSGSLKHFIYIPLCFYFIFSFCNGPYFSTNIYIPLCFYFIFEVQGFQRELS